MQRGKNSCQSCWSMFIYKKKESYADVGVLVDELDTLLEAPHAADEALKHVVEDFVLFAQFFLVAVQVLKPESNVDHHSEEEGPQGDGSDVVPEEPTDGFPDGMLILLVGLVEVPVADCSGDDELHEGDDEAGIPEEAKEVDVAEYLLVGGEYELSKGQAMRAVGDLPGAVEVEGNGEPEDEIGEDQDQGQERDEHNAEVVLDEVTGGLWGMLGLSYGSP